VADGTVGDPVQQPGQGLKAVVIGLGVLLAICAAIVVGTIVYRLFNAESSATAAGFGIAQLPVPPGCSIDQMTAEGDRLILRIGGSDACRRVLVTDLKTGALIGQFHFSSE
jgi:hypothetical protein